MARKVHPSGFHFFLAHGVRYIYYTAKYAKKQWCIPLNASGSWPQTLRNMDQLLKWRKQVVGDRWSSMRCSNNDLEERWGRTLIAPKLMMNIVQLHVFLSSIFCIFHRVVFPFFALKFCHQRFNATMRYFICVLCPRSRWPMVLETGQCPQEPLAPKKDHIQKTRVMRQFKTFGSSTRLPGAKSWIGEGVVCDPWDRNLVSGSRHPRGALEPCQRAQYDLIKWRKCVRSRKKGKIRFGS